MAQCVNYDIRPWQFVKSKRKNCKQCCQIKAKLLLQGHLTTCDQAMQYSVAKMTLNMTIVTANLILFELIWM